jgi:hypothetical protein
VLKNVKKHRKFEAELPKMNSPEIYLNVSRLEKGHYQLKIMDNNRLIKIFTFKK